MKIQWFGTATILIESDNQRILFDPYLKKLSYDKVDIEDLYAHYIFITHPHLDHYGDIKEIMEKYSAPVYVCQRGMDIAKQFNFPIHNIKVIKPNNCIHIGNIKITVYQGKHCHFDRKLVIQTLKRCLKKENIKQALHIACLNRKFKIDKYKDIYSYLLEIEDKRIFILGSANVYDYPKNIDILVYSFQGRSDIDTYSIDIIRKLKPDIIFLDHFDDAFPPISSNVDCKEFIKELNKFHIQCIYPQVKKEYFL